MALSAPIATPYQSRGPLRRRRVTLAASQTMHYGELVMADNAGLGRSCAALASNRGIIGVNLTPGTTTSGDIEVAEGEFLLPATSGLQNMVQTEIFGQADSTVGATGTNLPIGGICTEFVSATQLWVEVGPRARI
jgi:hypothetical protein